jgi:hypothetical protein
MAVCRAIIPLSSVVAGLLERYMFVYCLVSAPGMGNIRKDNKNGIALL